MKNHLALFFFFLTQFGFSQVGIGTENPTLGYELDVNGTLLVQDEFKVDGYTNTIVTNDDYKFLVRLLNSVPTGEVAYLDLGSISVGPVNIVNYEFTNVLLDNVEAVNLQFDADKYIVGLTNFRYVGEHIVKPTPGRIAIGDFRTRTYVDSITNTWHIEMRNVSLNADNSNLITYYATIMVYDRKYFKELTPILSGLGGGISGSAQAPTGL